MGTSVPPGTSKSPGLGLGWARTAEVVAEELSTDDVDGIWLFPPVRREEREWGVAVISRRAEGDRRRIYTASYMLIVRGRERGQGRFALEEVGEGPESVVPEVIQGVQQRAGEAEPPVEISPDVWFPPAVKEPVLEQGGDQTAVNAGEESLETSVDAGADP